MRWRRARPVPLQTAADGQLGSILNGTPFLLGHGHPMRGGRCIMCREVIGGDPVMIVGLVLLGGQPCRCGSVPTEMFLAHAAHTPVDVARLTVQVQDQVTMTHDHDWIPS